MVAETESFKNIIEACAQAAHEANRAYCKAIGDDAVPWDTAPDWQRESCREGVRGVLLRGNGPKESHASWLEHKTKEGWKYGPVKDPEKKEHPCFVPYEDLPDAQKAKDSIFTSVVHAVARALAGLTQPTLPGIDLTVDTEGRVTGASNIGSAAASEMLLGRIVRYAARVEGVLFTYRPAIILNAGTSFGITVCDLYVFDTAPGVVRGCRQGTEVGEWSDLPARDLRRAIKVVDDPADAD